MNVFLDTAWAIPLLPLLAMGLISLTPLRRGGRAAGLLATATVAFAAVLALGLLAAVAGHAAGPHAEGAAFAFPEPAAVRRFAWVATGGSTFEMGYYVDPLVAAMLAMVTLTSTAIHIFSLGYMAASRRQERFFSLIALFTAAMLMTVLADNLLLFFVAWEIMGVCSYMLIGFSFTRPQAYRAALKAFITTRVGDVLMLVGLAYLYTQAGGLQYGAGAGQIFNAQFLARIASETNALGMTHATAIALLLFCGTVGKSAQVPLHVWLPDAMEGPTPVSALIHAATMVAAGVFLIARTYPIFLASETALGVVAFVGTLTALVGALLALGQFEIKRILAYSTMSQLGMMVAVLGIGGWTAGVFHLLTHAFFKALLFLGSGAIIRAMETTAPVQAIHEHDEYAAQQTAQDIRNMGGLRERLPWTFWCYTAGYLALAGVIPFAGFWSKDEILADAFNGGHWVVFAALALVAFLTACYMTRQWLLVFFGRFRGDAPRVFKNAEPVPPDQEGAEDTEHAFDAHGQPRDPWRENARITAPLVMLALFALTAGAFNLPYAGPGGHWLSGLLGQEAAALDLLVALLSLLLAGTGIAAGYALYRGAFATAQERDPLEERAPGLFAALQNRLYIDQAYGLTLEPLTGLLTLLWRWLDRNVIDRVVDGAGALTQLLGRASFVADDTLLNDGPEALAKGTVAAGDRTRRTQTGKIEDYVTLLFGGALVLALVFVYWLRP
jgi:NADH-quinone oxidoreductase subunit L